MKGQEKRPQKMESTKIDKFNGLPSQLAQQFTDFSYISDTI